MGGIKMEITKMEHNQVLTLGLKGRLDTVSAPEFDREIEAVKEEPVRELHLDLKDLTYTSSAGLRVIYKAQQLMSSRNGMKVYNVSDDIRDIFDITGFLGMLKIE
jgi:anti-sigma B factor antagonist